MAKKEVPVSDDWTAQKGRIVGLWLSAGLVRTRKATGEIIRVTPKLFTVQVLGEDRVVRFQRTREFASSDGMRYEFGWKSRSNPSRVYRDPLPED